MNSFVFSSTQPIRAVLFDLGNTLIYFDSDWSAVMPDYNQALVSALGEAGFTVDPVRFPDEFRSRMDAYYDERDTEFIEYTTGHILRLLLRDHGYANMSAEALKPVLRSLYATTQAHWQVEPDSAPTLARLRDQGFQLAVVSNASDDEDVHTLIRKSHLDPYFSAVITSAAAGIRKPNPRIFQIVLDRLGVPPTQAVMIGDLLGADILGAHNAGMPAIWIDRRADKAANHDNLENVHPDATISTLSALPSLIARWNQERGVNPGRWNG